MNKRNRRKIGYDFEKEAKEILKNYFNKVIWLSESHPSSFDFKCIKDDKEYFGDAKLINYSSRSHLCNTQKEADFIIAKIKGKIELIWRDKFKEKVWIENKSSSQIQISNELWEKLNKKKQVGETFDEVIKRMLSEKRINPLPKSKDMIKDIKEELK
jgi:predicted CopG family antitoxin